jgi:4-amino-4-deoxy-L-arabinose transferase-like glycosyltransferase
MQKIKYWWIVVILITGYVVLSSNIGGLSIYALDEAKNAACAREMMESGNLIVPTFNGELRTDKPPLHYYFMMLSYQVFGVNPFAARFFSVIMGVFTLLITFRFVRRHADQRTAIFSVLVLLSSLHFNLQFHMAVPDPYLIFFTTLALFSVFNWLEDRQRLHLIIFYIALALGVLVKGPVAIALPGLIVLSYLFFSRKLNWKIFWQLLPWYGILLWVAIAVPWYVAVGIETDWIWIQEFFLKHNLNRYTDEMEGHGGIFLLTFGFVIIGMLPFAIFLPQSLRQAWQERKLPLTLFSLIAAAVIIGFFSLSGTKLPNYTVPAYPFLAVLIAQFLVKVADRDWKSYGIKASLLVFFFLSILFPVGTYIGLAKDKYLSHLHWLWVIWLALPVGAILAFYWAKRKENGLAFSSIGISFIISAILFFQVGFERIDRENPVLSSVEHFDISKPLAGYRFFNPAFVFYLQRELPRLESLAEVEAFFKTNPEGYLITRRKYLEDLKENTDLKVVIERKDLFEIPTTVILRKESSP